MVFNRIIFVLVYSILISSCISQSKRYEDYNEDDFYEVQGVITKITPTSNLFDSSRKKDILYDYHLDLDIPLRGGENDIDLVLNEGDPIVVLVHKHDRKINFYGRYGIIDSRLKME